MIGVSYEAAGQIEALLDYYLYELDPPRPEAAEALLVELSEARARITAAPHSGRSHPATYLHLRSYGFLWLRVKSYWVAWTVLAGRPVVTNVFHAAADIERRASPSVSGAEDW